MKTTLKEVEAAAKELSAEEQIELAARLLDSQVPASNEKLDQYWIDTARRRIGEIREGKVQCVDGDEVLARGRAILNETV